MMMKRVAAFVLLSAVFPAASFAFTFTGQSRTYLQARESVSGENLTPLYQYLDFKMENFKTQELSLHFGGWGRVDLTGETRGKTTNGDLQYAYISYRRKKSNALLSAGRLYIFEGVAAEKIDGLFARTDMRAGFGVSVYGGTPVETDVNGRSGDSIYGGRLTQGLPGRYLLGVSYLKERDGSADFREEGGVDLWWRPFTKLDLQGRSGYNAITSNWMRHNYYLTLGPFSKFKVNAEASKVYYEDYFYNATVSAFTAPGLDPNEVVQILGGGLGYAFTSSLTGVIDYKNYDYELAGDADYYGGRLVYAAARYSAGLLLYRMDGATDRLRYGEYRAYAKKKWGKTDATIDLLLVSYDEAINTVKNAYTAVGVFGYDISTTVRTAADLEYSHNPDYENELKAFVKLIYRFDVSSR